MSSRSGPRSASREKVPDEVSIWADGIRTMGNGFLKALKGPVNILVAPFMGASGLGYADIDEILNAPFPDWMRLWEERRKELNADRSGGQQLIEGALGFFKGLANGLKNGLKDIFVGIFPMLFGGIYIVKKLKELKDDFGLEPDIIKAALKTGHPIGLMIGAAGMGLEKVNDLCQKLRPQLEKYQSLGEVGQAALGAIQQRERDIQLGIEQGTQALKQATGRDFTQAGRQLSRAAAVGQSVYQQVKNGDLKTAKEAVRQLGITPEKLVVEQGRILLREVPAAKKAEAIQAILKSNPKFGLIARAKSYDDALRKLVARGDLNIIERLTAVNLPDGSSLAKDQVEQLKAAAKKQLAEELGAVAGRKAETGSGSLRAATTTAFSREKITSSRKQTTPEPSPTRPKRRR